MHQEDYYTTLGVAAGAGSREIKEAYRKLAFQFHPDRNRDNPAAAESMKRINEAYAVLSHASRRREYDALRQQFGASAQSRFRSAHSEHDIFNGSDINAVFEEMARVFGLRSFEDIFRDCYGRDCREYGFRRPRASIRRFVFSRGFPPGVGPRAGTPASGGLGRIARFALRRLSGLELPENGATLRDRIYLDPGLAATGGPYAYFHRGRSKKLVVKVPPGVREGQHIRLSGMGRHGRAGGASGDLLLEVRFHRPWWQRLWKRLPGRWRK
jgi:curved DNA-binding protein